MHWVEGSAGRRASHQGKALSRSANHLLSNRSVSSLARSIRVAVPRQLGIFAQAPLDAPASRTPPVMQLQARSRRRLVYGVPHWGGPGLSSAMPTPPQKIKKKKACVQPANLSFSEPASCEASTSYISIAFFLRPSTTSAYSALLAPLATLPATSASLHCTWYVRPPHRSLFSMCYRPSLP